MPLPFSKAKEDAFEVSTKDIVTAYSWWWDHGSVAMFESSET